MLENLFGRGLVDNPSVHLLLFQDAGLHLEVLQSVHIAFVRGCRQTLYRMRCVLHPHHAEGLQTCELIEDIEEFPNAKVALHLIFADELYIVEDELGETAAEVLSV